MISITLDRCEIKENQEACESFVEAIDAMAQDIFSEPGISFSGAESRVFEGFRLIRQKFLEMFLSHQANEEPSEPVDCPKCGQVCRRRYKRERRITTLCGVIRVERWVYGCAAGHYHVLWDDQQKLIGQYTHRVAEAMCRLAARLDFREASEELSYQGIKVRHETLHQIMDEMSEGVNVPEQVETQKLEENQRWYVSCDGCHTNSPDGWKEVKAGCVYRDYPLPPDSSGAISRARTTSIRYVASREGVSYFGKELYKLAINSGIYQEDIDTQEIVLLGDGAPWIWNIAKEYFPNAVQIVDHMHATSHLYNVAKVAFGETETEAIDTWIKETEPLLYDGNITAVASNIRALTTQHPEVSEVLERKARYFEKHAKRPQYKAFREKGYQIGSGVIESACKHVVGQRCKQAAMRWKRPGINAVLKMRCLLKNGGWNKYWYPDAKAA